MGKWEGGDGSTENKKDAKNQFFFGQKLVVGESDEGFFFFCVKFVTFSVFSNSQKDFS